jgi:hypothetical protein
MGSYDRLMPYPIEYTQFISSSIAGRMVEVLGDETGLHLGTAVDQLGWVAGEVETEDGGEVSLMAVAVAWGKMLGVRGMDEVCAPQGTQKPKDQDPIRCQLIRDGLTEVLRENGAHRSTWGTLLVVAAMDLVHQARDVIDPSVPKTILLRAIAEGSRNRETTK